MATAAQLTMENGDPELISTANHLKQRANELGVLPWEDWREAISILLARDPLSVEDLTTLVSFPVIPFFEDEQPLDLARLAGDLDGLALLFKTFKPMWQGQMDLSKALWENASPALKQRCGWNEWNLFLTMDSQPAMHEPLVQVPQVEEVDWLREWLNGEPYQVLSRMRAEGVVAESEHFKKFVEEALICEFTRERAIALDEEFRRLAQLRATRPDPVLAERFYRDKHLGLARWFGLTKAQQAYWEALSEVIAWLGMKGVDTLPSGLKQKLLSPSMTLHPVSALLEEWHKLGSPPLDPLRTLRLLDFDPLLLREQPNGGIPAMDLISAAAPEAGRGQRMLRLIFLEQAQKHLPRREWWIELIRHQEEERIADNQVLCAALLRKYARFLNSSDSRSMEAALLRQQV